MTFCLNFFLHSALSGYIIVTVVTDKDVARLMTTAMQDQPTKQRFHIHSAKLWRVSTFVCKDRFMVGTFLSLEKKTEVLSKKDFNVQYFP
jgi:hypothetical protein